MSHELVVVLELVAFDADDGTVIGDADQEISALGVQERGDGFQDSVCDEFVVLAVFFEVPCTFAAKCSTMIRTVSPIACGCSSTNDLSRYSAFFLSLSRRPPALA
jgi:hypothetical protein